MKKLLTGFILTSLVLTVIVPAFAQEIEGTPTDPATEEATTQTATTTPELATSTVPALAEVSTVIATTSPVSEETEAASPVELIVKFKESAADLDRSSGRREAEAAVSDAGGVLESHLIEANSAVVTVANEEEARMAIHVLENDSSVEYAEPNYERSISTIAPDDALFSTQWSLKNTGQVFNSVAGTVGADIDAQPAWDLSLGTSTVVAVIDNGVFYTHPDLVNTMWDGTSCVSDTGAVLGNCLSGYDFADSDTAPLPQATTSSDTYHGTHVAGIIAAELNNATGTVGVAPKAKIMALRFGLDVASEVRAIDFAIQNGAKIINASFGGTQFSQAEYDAIARFEAAGGIFIAAAGNENVNIDTTPLYPASYTLSNIVSVAATDHTDGLAVFSGGASNYGDVSVDLAAPGRFIQSTIAVNGTTTSYGYLSGTSMAAPMVAGVAALLKSRYFATSTATSSAKAMKSALVNSGDTLPSLAGKTLSGKRLNALNALTYLASDLVAPVISLIGNASVSLTVGDVYVDAGATALDDIDPSVTVVATSTVDTATAGTYTVTYAAQDLAGNQATPVVRTVTVSAAPVPVIEEPRRRSGGGGGRSKAKEETNPARPLLTIPTTSYATLTPEQRTQLLNVLLTLLSKLQAQLAALQAQGR